MSAERRGRGSGNSFGVGVPDFSFVGRVETDARNSRCFLDEIVRGPISVAGHDRTGGQGKAQGVRLVLKIQNDLTRHRYFS